MITCQKATELVSESQEKRLSLSQVFSLWMHLKICKGCMLFKEQLKLLRSVAQKMRSETNSLSKEAKERIKQSLN